MTLRTAALALVLVTTGCTATASPPSTSILAVRAASAADFPALALGSFKPSPGLARGGDRSVGLRSVTITPPNGRSFSQFLGETIGVQLRLAGKLDPASPITLSGEMTETDANTRIGRANGAIAAIFRLHAGGRVVFEKALRVEANWNSSFIGAVAIPNAEREYTALYPKLVETLFNDPDFRAALRTLR
jgi:hypothetical protein